MDAAAVAASLVPSWSAVLVLFSYLGYLAAAGAVLPGKLVPGAVLPDSSRLHYRCNGLLSLLLLLVLSALGVYMGWMSPTVIADRGIELLSTTFIFSVIVGGITHLTSLLSYVLFVNEVTDLKLGANLNNLSLSTN
jgi:delta14-sterol reductase